MTRRTLVIGAAVAVVAAIGLAFILPTREWLAGLEESLENMSTGKALAAFVAVSVMGTMLLVPAWIFPIVAGAVFGLGWGIPAALASGVTSALLAYLVARHLLRDKVERAARRTETFLAVEQAVKREPWKVVALLRLSPVLPSGLKSYFLGLTCVKPFDYTFASAVGMLPGILIKVYLGSAGRDALTTGGATKWALVALGLAATLAMAFIVSRAASRRLHLR